MQKPREESKIPISRRPAVWCCVFIAALACSGVACSRSVIVQADEDSADVPNFETVTDTESKSADVPLDSETVPPATDLVFTTVEQRDCGGNGIPFNELITDQSDWAGFYEWLVGSYLDEPIVPPIDFDREMVVGVGIGSRPDCGYRVDIRSITRSDGHIEVAYVETIMGNYCAIPQLVSAPYHLVKLERESFEVHFVSTQKVEDCVFQ